jgi:transcriptional regulator with XRE-family HTH domain
MVIRKMRRDRGWSQEHLAAVSGLNVRTIQRVEGGKEASLETLMSLASALEVEVSALQQELALADVPAAERKQQPGWVRLLFSGSRCAFVGPDGRRSYLRQELVWAVGGTCLLLLGTFLPKPISPPLFATGITLLTLAGAFHLVTKLGDKYEVW